MDNDPAKLGYEKFDKRKKDKKPDAETFDSPPPLPPPPPPPPPSNPGPLGG